MSLKLRRAVSQKGMPPGWVPPCRARVQGLGVWGPFSQLLLPSDLYVIILECTIFKFFFKNYFFVTWKSELQRNREDGEEERERESFLLQHHSHQLVAMAREGWLRVPCRFVVPRP